MITLSTDKQNVTLCAPNPDRDAPFALQWFDSPYGKDTLLLMGNAENEIQPSTLESERKTIQEFLDLEAVHKQYTWMIRHEDQTIGAVWLELVDIPELKSPAVHIMIGNKAYRGQGIGEAVIARVLTYTAKELNCTDIYSRHLASNHAAKKLLSSLGFQPSEAPYDDVNGLVWQNVHTSLK